jgi:hypothetical protein
MYKTRAESTDSESTTKSIDVNQDFYYINQKRRKTINQIIIQLKCHLAALGAVNHFGN